MKKLCILWLPLAIALCLTSCQDAFENAAIDLSGSDLCGDLFPSGTDGNKGIPFSGGDGMEKSGDGYSYTMSSYTSANFSSWGGGNGTFHFKVRKQAGTWDGGDYAFEDMTEGALLEGVTFEKDGNNPCLKGLVEGGKYTLTFTPLDSGKIELSVDGYVPEVQVVDTDKLETLSALFFGDTKLTSTDSVYLSIEGDSCSDTTTGKYFFKPVGTDFVATAYVTTGDAFADWGRGTSAYSCWGKVYWGDNSAIKSDSKKWKWDSGALSFKDGDNFFLENAGKSTLYKITVTVSASSSNMKMEKVE